MKLILIRHGESTANAATEKIYQGHLDTDLSELGKAQAKKLAERFKNIHFDYIYSSDLKRAKDTAKEILKYHKDKNLILDKRLRERHHGDFTGKSVSEIDQSFFEEDIIKRKAPNGENYFDHKIRAEQFINELLEKYKTNETIVLVSHGINTKVIPSILLNIDPYEVLTSKYKTSNTCVYEIEINQNKEAKIITQNCTKHLE